ncbi:rRNA pseudouridine synthase [Gemella sp. GH3]|uniref:pseudouridine synthase n=1 Tax=unclassified Gemella TaxID=2624949 RepID=UPI0015D049D1|nr:rRNA pseudouridine synthase [Gemella sp. GH3.1]NYS51123.1 rRNA pseudouridine synthase [Gemella sp. GH3]
MRLDKYISSSSLLTRSEVKKVIKKGVLVNGELIKKADYKVDELTDIIEVLGERLEYREFIYIMLNKPQGIISATEDKIDKTVVDLLEDRDRILNPFPVGRLDKDTEGLILLTNDGDLAHKLLSPKKDITKKYYVEVDKDLNDNDKELFFKGIILDDGYLCKSAKLEIISNKRAYLTISEGKFHQIKRMMKAINRKVTYLKRLEIGPLILDDSLPLGKYRHLSKKEINNLQIIKEK